MQKAPERKSFLVDAECVKYLETQAEETGSTMTKIVNDAIRLYRDKNYMEDKSMFITEEMKEFTSSLMALLETKLNNRSNQLISSLAIEQAIITQALAEGLNLSPDSVERYRKNAIDFLKTNNRVLDMKDVL